MKGTVLVCLSCYNKYITHSLGDLNNKHFFLTVLEDSKSKMKVQVRHMGSTLMTSSKSNYLPKVPLPNTITLGVGRASKYEFGEGGKQTSVHNRDRGKDNMEH